MEIDNDAEPWRVTYEPSHKQQYKHQRSVFGISDHLPVWAQFNVTASAQIANGAQATSGTDNNCLFHAVYGQEVNGMITDQNAAQHRMQLVQHIAGFNLQSDPAARHDLLSAMIACFDGDAEAFGFLAAFLERPDVDPRNQQNAAITATWNDLLNRYLSSISQGRMMFVHEAALVARMQPSNIRLWRMNNGNLDSTDLSPGAPNQGGQQVDIYHFGVHFFRFDPGQRGQG